MNVTLKLNTGKVIELEDGEFSALRKAIKEEDELEAKDRDANEEFFSSDLGSMISSLKPTTVNTEFIEECKRFVIMSTLKNMYRD